MRSQKVVKRERENQTQKKRQRRVNSANGGRQRRKQNYRKGEKRQLSIGREEPVPCERGWR